MRRERRGGRPKEPPILDPANHPKSSVCLRVAAEFLELDERSVRARVERGDILGWQDVKVYRIDLQSLMAYDARRRKAS